MFMYNSASCCDLARQHQRPACQQAVLQPSCLQQHQVQPSLTWCYQRLLQASFQTRTSLAETTAEVDAHAFRLSSTASFFVEAGGLAAGLQIPLAQAPPPADGQHHRPLPRHPRCYRCRPPIPPDQLQPEHPLMSVHAWCWQLQCPLEVACGIAAPPRAVPLMAPCLQWVAQRHVSTWIRPACRRYRVTATGARVP